MARLVELRRTCREIGCDRAAVVELRTRVDTPVGVYCRQHGTKMLRGVMASEVGALCGACGHPIHWRECRAAGNGRLVDGCYCRRRGPHSDAPLTEEQVTTRAGKPWPEGDK